MSDYKTYRHFKGGLYEVIMVATMESTGEELIIYKPAGQTCFAEVWARTRESFFEEVDVNGEMLPRFKWEKK